MSSVEVLKQYNLGYPYQFSIMGFGFTFLLAPIVISFFYLTGGIISAIPLMPMGYYLVFIRKHMYISKESYKIENRLPLLIWGKWVPLKDYKAITIKYTILNANKGAKRGNNPKDPMKKIDLKQPNQDLKDTDETWLVHLINSKNEKILLIDTSKKTALEIITLIMEQSSLKPYLSNYRNGFELDERLLRSGQLKISS